MNYSAHIGRIAKAIAILLAISTLLVAFPFVEAVAEEDETLVITLDPGHGGKPSADGSTGTGTNAAAVFGGVNELFYTLSISEYCKERLEQYQNVRST